MGQASRRKKEGRPSEPSHRWLRSIIAAKSEERDLAAARYHFLKERVEALEKQLAEKEASEPAPAEVTSVSGA